MNLVSDIPSVTQAVRVTVTGYIEIDSEKHNLQLSRYGEDLVISGAGGIPFDPSQLSHTLQAGTGEQIYFVGFGGPTDGDVVDDIEGLNLNISITTTAPPVEASAQYNEAGPGPAETFGPYVLGIPLLNTFTVTPDPSITDITDVEYQFVYSSNGVVMDLGFDGIATETAKGQWTFKQDVGALSGNSGQGVFVANELLISIEAGTSYGGELPYEVASAAFSVDTLQSLDFKLTASNPGNGLDTRQLRFISGVDVSPTFTETIPDLPEYYARSLTAVQVWNFPGGPVNIPVTPSPALGGGLTFNFTTDTGNLVGSLNSGVMDAPVYPVFTTATGPTVNPKYGYPFIQIADKEDTTTILKTDSPAGSVYGQKVTFTATVYDTDTTAGTPTGSVEFEDGDTVLGTVELVGGVATFSTSDLPNGVATFSTSDLPAGDHHVVAVFTSNRRNFNGSTSNTVTQTVDKADTVGYFGIGPFSTVYGQNVRFNSLVLPFSSTPTVPTGFVYFYDGSNKTVIMTLPVDTFGDLSTLAAGTHTITAIYGGDNNFNGTALQSPDLVVAKAPLTVTADDQSIDHGDPVPSLTYKVKGFVNGDSSAVLSGSPDFETDTTGKAGVYPIDVSTGTLSAANYAFNFVPGTLTVHPVVTGVIAHYGSKSISLSGLKRDLPFADITSIEILFSDNVVIPGNTITLAGRGGKQYALSLGSNSSPTGVIFNPFYSDAILGLPSALGADQLALSLTKQIYALSAAGATLKPFQLSFSVLPGDVNGDNAVDSLDLVAVRNGILGALDKGVDVWADIDGSGAMDIGDYNAVKKYVGKHL